MMKMSVWQSGWNHQGFEPILACGKLESLDKDSKLRHRVLVLNPRLYVTNGDKYMTPCTFLAGVSAKPFQKYPHVTLTRLIALDKSKQANTKIGKMKFKKNIIFLDRRQMSELLDSRV